MAQEQKPKSQQELDFESGEHEVMCVGETTWGVGATVLEATFNARKAGLKGRDYVLVLVPKGAQLSQMGMVSYHKDCKCCGMKLRTSDKIKAY